MGGGGGQKTLRQCPKVYFLVGNPERIANSKSDFVCVWVCYRESLNLYYAARIANYSRVS